VVLALTRVPPGSVYEISAVEVEAFQRAYNVIAEAVV
jgi:hypothetical protein